MNTIRLSKCGIETTRLGFGTSRLHYLDARARHSMLSMAFDLGVKHVDTAPAYGDGLAELACAKFLKDKRDRVVLVTKYGVPADPILQAMPMLSPGLRIARGVARRMGLWSAQLPKLNALGLVKSVEQSLRRLSTDYIDIVLLHEPTLDRIPHPAELLSALEKLKQRGVVRAFGLSGYWSDVGPILNSPTHQLCEVLQTEASAQTHCAVDIAFSAISQGQQGYFKQPLSSSLAQERLADALRGRPNGVVLISTTKPQNLKESIAIAERTAA
jgi:aryl-alcohol dehydrogenase-like predicted oxidoreductase